MVDFHKELAKMKKLPRIDLNPSSADRWTTCTASPQFIFDNHDKLTPSDTAYNQEGTTAHEVACAILEDRQARVKDKWYCPVPVTKEMNWHGWSYAEYVLGLRESGGHLFVEQKLPLWYMEDRNAIVDAAVINERNLHVIDYKYGEGIVVSPENNLQASIYARSVVRKYAVHIGEDFPITVHIYQPRGRGSSESPFHLWETTWGEIKEITDKIEFIAKGINGPPFPTNLAFAPSEKACQWCPAKGFCFARQATLTESLPMLAEIESGPKHLVPVKAVSMKQLAALVEHGSQLIKWIQDANKYALDYVKQGGQIPGFKLVQSREGNRYWRDEDAAAKILLLDTHLRANEVIVKSTIGPAAVEKLIGTNKFTADLMNLIGRPPGKAVLAPLSDPREDLRIDPVTEFEVLDNEEF